MRVAVRHSCADFDSYRAARIKSLFNAESGCRFELDAELPIEGWPWQVGAIVGPSGSGKTSLGRELFGAGSLWDPEWPRDRPIIDAIAPAGSFDDATTALAGVGLGSVPSWLRPFHVLSAGEQFRANLARALLEAGDPVVFDEFTSVVDRQIARFGALAFQKAWRRRGAGRAVVLSCHHDVLEWLEPDWIFDTRTGAFSRGRLRRPRFTLEVLETDRRYWPTFEPHYYLKLPPMIAATYYVGRVERELVAHLAVSTRPGLREARASRLVVMPEWQGAGIGLRFLNAVCDRWARGKNRYSKPMPTLFHTSHPGLCAALRRDRARWVQVSCMLYGGNKRRSRATLLKSGSSVGGGYGGHFRAVQGFRYLGAP